MSVRTLALSMVSVFLPLYLYNLGYSLTAIMWYFLVFSLVRIPANFIAGYVIGKIGPKHTIAISTIAETTYMILLVSLKSFGWPILLLSVVQSIANSLFFTAYHVDFSKIKQTSDAGKEFSHMVVLEKIFGMIGPLVGGILATLVDVRLSVGVSIALLMLSLVPLFLSGEPVKLNQHVFYGGITQKLVSSKANILAILAINLGTVLSSITWVLFIGIAVFRNDVYAYIGVLATVTTLLSIILAKYIGNQTDLGKGPKYMRIGAYGGVVFSLTKIFVNTPMAVAANSFFDAQALTIRQIPLGKGFYSETDNFPGQRIAYMVMLENLVHIFRIPFIILIILALSYFDNQMEVLRYATVAAGTVTIFMVFEKFKILRTGKSKT
ncbi:MFS transporter [Candidatus Saccharibacteria bacterium]|nr:MFS transporter [Candidatus Saccharibacteria bacterium]MCB9821097.1 MFS transporter [Candidatus Nomurabacteria bacterium]